MKYQILIYPHPGLTTPAEPVTVFDDELKQICQNLIETMYDSRGIGLAATQVNINKRILVLDTSEDNSQPRCFINPVITYGEETATETEGCLSFPGLYIDITRPQHIKVTAVDESGNSTEIEADGLLARCLQHELDHLDGMVFTDRLSRLKRDRALKKFEKYKKTNASGGVES